MIFNRIKITILVSLSLVFLLPTLSNSESYYRKAKQHPQIKIIGIYTNEQSSDGEHSFGYTLHLYSYKQSHIGWLTLNEGLIGSGTPKPLSNIVIGAVNELEFRADYGSTEVFFNGILKSNSVEGNFFWSNGITDTLQVLRRCCQDGYVHKNYQTIEEFNKDWKSLQ